MKWIAVAMIVLTLPAYAQTGSLFDPNTQAAPSSAAGGNRQAAIPQQAAAAGYVTNGSQATLVRSMEDAIASIKQQADQAASDGDTELRDALMKEVPPYEGLLEKAKTRGLHPSLYPFELGKKGCLFAFRKSKTRVGPADKAGSVEYQVISWMRVKITGQRDDGSFDAEIRDNAGRLVLYKACLHDLTSESLKPGVTAQLINVKFEVISEEESDGGTIYHLKHLPPGPPLP